MTMKGVRDVHSTAGIRSFILLKVQLTPDSAPSPRKNGSGPTRIAWHGGCGGPPSGCCGLGSTSAFPTAALGTKSSEVITKLPNRKPGPRLSPGVRHVLTIVGNGIGIGFARGRRFGNFKGGNGRNFGWFWSIGSRKQGSGRNTSTFQRRIARLC